MARGKSLSKQEIFPSRHLQIDLRLPQEQITRSDNRIKRLRLDRKPFHENDIFEVKFCPFIDDDAADPVFACATGSNVLVFRVKSTDDGSLDFDLLRAIYDTDESVNLKANPADSFQMLHTLAWMRDPNTNDALLLFSGIVPRINIYNVTTGNYVKTITGHGSSIQEIVPHPTCPSVFATCCDDNELRLWNLKSRHPDSHCAVICKGEFGHTGTPFSVVSYVLKSNHQPEHLFMIHDQAFTNNGRYLISGGRDHWIHLWALPPEERLENLPEQPERSHRVSNPHFSSAEVHGDTIDCIRFYGDLIFSRSAQRDILCWRIDGFSSTDEIPKLPPTKHHHDTRTYSAFGGKFTTICKFSYGFDGGAYYNRFSIFPGGPNARPKLTMGLIDPNHREGPVAIFLWDLQNIDEHIKTNFEGNEAKSVEHQQILKPKVRLNGRKKFGSYRMSDWSWDGKHLVAGFDHGLVMVWKRKDSPPASESGDEIMPDAVVESV